MDIIRLDSRSGKGLEILSPNLRKFIQIYCRSQPEMARGSRVSRWLDLIDGETLTFVTLLLSLEKWMFEEIHYGVNEDDLGK